jgi:hypothetical protein
MDVPIITAVISLIVQGYFCYRIWVLNKRSSWVCWIIAVAAVTQSAAQVWSSIKPLVDGEIKIVKTAIYIWSISSSLADILIAVAMTLLLRRAIGNFSSFVLVRVVRLTVETNTLTATLAIASLVLYVAFPNELYFIFTVEIIGKVYSNTLLVSLNNRIYLRDRLSPGGYRDTTRSTVSERIRTKIVTPPRSSDAETQPRASTSDAFQLFGISHQPDKDHQEDVETKLPASVFST